MVKERQPPLQEYENLRKTQDFPLVLGPWTDPGRGRHCALRGRKVLWAPKGRGSRGTPLGAKRGGGRKETSRQKAAGAVLDIVESTPHG